MSLDLLGGLVVAVVALAALAGWFARRWAGEQGRADRLRASVDAQRERDRRQAEVDDITARRRRNREEIGDWLSGDDGPDAA